MAVSEPMLDRLTDPFFAVGDDWRFSYLNGPAAALLGGSRSELLGRAMWDALPDAVETQLPEALYDAMDDGGQLTFELYHGEVDRWFETRAYPSETGLSVHMRDVTDRRERRSTLARQGAILEAVRDGIVTLDAENRILSANETIERTLEVDADELVGEHVEALLERAGVDVTAAIELGRAIGDVDLGIAPQRRVEVEFTDATGSPRVGEVRLVPVDFGEASLAAVVRDVTDRREYERVVGSLHEITRWLLDSEDPEEICAIAVHAGSDLLGLPMGGIWLLDEERGYLDPVAATATAHEELGGLPRFRRGEGLVWNVFERGELARYDDLREVEGLYDPSMPIRSQIVAPIGDHGVLVTASTEPQAFDATDVDLLSTLAENIRAALNRTDRERVLRERTDRLERRTDRLEAVADLLSTELEDSLLAVEEALDEGDADGRAVEDARRTLDRAERLLADVREFAATATAVGPRTRIDLGAAVEAAVDESALEPASVIVEDRATLRADPDRFAHLLETVLDDAAVLADEEVVVQVGLLTPEGPVDEPRGFFLRHDAGGAAVAGEQPRTDVVGGEEEPRTDVAGGEEEPRTDVAGGKEEPRTDVDTSPRNADGLGVAVAEAIAEAHGWTATVERTGVGQTRFSVRNVVTIERASATGG